MRQGLSNQTRLAMEELYRIEFFVASLSRHHLHTYLYYATVAKQNENIYDHLINYLFIVHMNTAIILYKNRLVQSFFGSIVAHFICISVVILSAVTMIMRYTYAIQ